MKGKYILVSLLLVALVMGGTGYGVSAGSGGKVTGGGTFTNEAIVLPWMGPPSPYANFGDKISFGFTAQSQGNGVKGQFHLTNHDSGMKVSGTVSAYSVTTSWVEISGPCSIDGVSTSFWAKLSDGGEGAGPSDRVVGIWFDDPDGNPDIKGRLAKGNVQKHK